MTSSATSKVVKDVIFINQATWEPWFNSIRASVKDHLWRYFDLEQFDTFSEPQALILSLPEQPPVTGISSAGPSTKSTPAFGTVVKIPAQQTACKLQNKKQLETHYKAVSAYSQLKRDWEKIADAQTKLQDQIQASVAQHKAFQLNADLSVHQWLQALKASTAPPVETIKQSIKVDYQRFVLVGYFDWPIGGPSNWVSKWEDLMHRAQKYWVTLDNWLNNVVHIWKHVPALSNYFFTVSIHIIQHKAYNYTVASVASDINWQWELKKQRDNVKVSKPKTTRLAFTTQEATLRKEADKTAATEATNTSKKPSRKNKKRKRTSDKPFASSMNVAAAAVPALSSSASSNPRKTQRTEANNKHTSEGRKPCKACEIPYHNFHNVTLCKEGSLR